MYSITSTSIDNSLSKILLLIALPERLESIGEVVILNAVS